MKIFELLCIIIVCLKSNTLGLPGPQVYVVTPSSRQLQIDEVKSPPFYYHNWMRRMDTNSQTSTTTTASSKVKTPDLIFAELESDDKKEKSIRKLLEKEKVTPKTTTSHAIYVPDAEITTRRTAQSIHEDLKPKQEVNQEKLHDEINVSDKSPVYVPNISSTTTPKSMTTTPINLENIWHIIDNEKLNRHQGNWDEIPITNGVEGKILNKQQYQNNLKQGQDNEEQNWDKETENVKIDDTFALPGFAKNPGSGAENESRAIRNEPNLRFPYVNLKPFQMKTLKKPLISGNSKKTNMIDLSNFYDLKEPVRGEAQDFSPVSLQVDRYNPAQPYLPKPEYGSNLSKQNNLISSQGKFTANLVPPPPVPKITGDDFPSPSSYESFPPYPPSSANKPFASAPKPESPLMNPADDLISSDDSDNGVNSAMDLGYRYKPPSAPMPQFIPTVPPPEKFDGYSYNKPSTEDEMPSLVVDKPDLQGYHYEKPESPSMKKPDFKGYEYSKPDVPQFFDHKPSYGPSITYQEHNLPPSDHDSDYPELIYNKPHGDMKGNDDMKDMGMMPPPSPADIKPNGYGPLTDDHGFPSDFPDVKYHNFDDHDHYHHHHTTTTTTTTEMPRVDRYSYYYLGKKLYYLPLYFSVYFIVYVGALIIKAVLRHKITYPNSWRPNDTTSTFFSKRSVDNYLSNDNLHEITGKVTNAIATAAEKYMNNKRKT